MQPAFETEGMTLDWSCTTDLAEVRRAFCYWDRKRAGRELPARSDIIPSEIKDILPIVQLYDLLEHALAYRVRLLGTRIAKAFPESPTGQIFDGRSAHTLVKRMLMVFGHVARERRPLIARATNTAIDSLSFAAIESIYLPLSESGAEVDIVFAATVVKPPRSAITTD
jgi:hypothetical protein